MTADGWQEEWRPVVGFEGFYEVSNAGTVRGVARRAAGGRGISQAIPARVLKPKPGPRGYVYVTLRTGAGRRRVVGIHRLVAMAFLPNPNDKPGVNHIDNDPANNRVDNLEWCTQAENLAHMTAQGRRRNSPPAAEWRDIATAPRDGTWFLGFWPVHTVEDQHNVTSWMPWHLNDDPAFVTAADNIDWCQPTHWMPLPPAPVSA